MVRAQITACIRRILRLITQNFFNALHPAVALAKISGMFGRLTSTIRKRLKPDEEETYTQDRRC